MNKDKTSNPTIHVVGCHAEGEVGDVVVDGVTLPEAESLWEQSRLLAKDTRLKDFLLNEPRGGVFRHVNIITPARNPKAQMGNIILEPVTVPPMSGSNTMCVTTVLLETGILPMQEPETKLTLEMPGGLIEVTASCKGGKVTSVTFNNLPSFVDRLDIPLEVKGLGTINTDIAFGGDSFVVVDARALGFSLKEGEARSLTEAGMAIAAAAQEQIGFTHPTLNGMNEITFCLLAGPVNSENGKRISKHAVAIKPGKLDRSPTGTGVSARLALMHKRGKACVGDEVIFQSVLGSQFTGRIQKEVILAGRDAIIPSVTGRAWITGTKQLTLDPEDPWPTGYRLSDTWPNLT